MLTLKDNNLAQSPNQPQPVAGEPGFNDLLIAKLRAEKKKQKTQQPINSTSHQQILKSLQNSQQESPPVQAENSQPGNPPAQAEKSNPDQQPWNPSAQVGKENQGSISGSENEQTSEDYSPNKTGTDLEEDYSNSESSSESNSEDESEGDEAENESHYKLAIKIELETQLVNKAKKILKLLTPDNSSTIKFQTTSFEVRKILFEVRVNGTEALSPQDSDILTKYLDSTNDNEGLNKYLERISRAKQMDEMSLQFNRPVTLS